MPQGWLVTDASEPWVFMGLRCNGELLLGAAGGCGMDVGDGAVIQPMFGLSRDLGERFAILAQIGRVMTLSGDLDTMVIGVGLGNRLPPVLEQ